MNFKLSFLVLIIIGFFKFGNAQIPSNTLFIIIDDKNEFVEIDRDNRVKINYTVWNKEQNWYSYFTYFYKPNYKKNHFKYLLPKEMFFEFKGRGNVITSDEFEKTLIPLKLKEARDLINLRYPRYYFEYFDGPELKKDRRYGIFLVLKSDLENNHIECYEADFIFDLIQQH